MVPWRSDPQRQARLGPFQRLALALLVTAQHQRACTCLIPSDRRKTMAARKLSRLDADGALTRRSNSCRSDAVSSSRDTGRAMAMKDR